MAGEKLVLLPKELLERQQYRWFLEHPDVKARIAASWEKAKVEYTKVDVLFTAGTLVRRFLGLVRRDREVSAARKNLTEQIVALSLRHDLTDFPEGVRVERQESISIPYGPLLGMIPKEDLPKVADRIFPKSQTAFGSSISRDSSPTFGRRKIS